MKHFSQDRQLLYLAFNLELLNSKYEYQMLAGSVSLPEDGGSMFLRYFVSIYKPTRLQNPEDRHQQLRCEKLKLFFGQSILTFINQFKITSYKP
jgi:hypothetical protein